MMQKRNNASTTQTLLNITITFKTYRSLDLELENPLKRSLHLKLIRYSVATTKIIKEIKGTLRI